MRCDPAMTDRINSFALVSYIPGRLGDFITRLREDLVRGCVADRTSRFFLPARCTSIPILPPSKIRSGLAPFNAFELDMPRIRCFRADVGRVLRDWEGPRRTVRSARSDEYGTACTSTSRSITIRMSRSRKGFHAGSAAGDL